MAIQELKFQFGCKFGWNFETKKSNVHDVPPAGHHVPYTAHDGKKFPLWARVWGVFLLFLEAKRICIIFNFTCLKILLIARAFFIRVNQRGNLLFFAWSKKSSKRKSRQKKRSTHKTNARLPFFAGLGFSPNTSNPCAEFGLLCVLI